MIKSREFTNTLNGKTLKQIPFRTDFNNPILGSTLPFFDRSTTMTFLKNSHKQNSPIIVSYTYQENLVEVVDPFVVKEICLSKKLKKHYVMNQVFDSLVGQGLVATEGEIWKRHRNLILPAFSPSNVKNMMYAMITEINKKLDDFDKTELLFDNFNHQLSQITLYVIVAVAFGVDLENIDELAQNFENLSGSFTPILLTIVTIGQWFTKLPLPFFSKFTKAKKEIHKTVFEIIKKKKLQEKPKEFKELISILIHANDEDGEKFTDQEIFDESMTFLVAGHETSTSLLSFLVYQLALNPKLQEELFDEIQTNIENKDKPTYQEIENLQLMNNCIKESLRMFPPGSFINRSTGTKDEELYGYMIPKNSRILINIIGIHYHPKYWKNPTEFIPERWNDINMKDVKYQFLPFSLGPRDCAGRNLAMIEAPLIMVLLMMKYKFQFPDNFDPETIHDYNSFTAKLTNFQIKLKKRK